MPRCTGPIGGGDGVPTTRLSPGSTRCPADLRRARGTGADGGRSRPGTCHRRHRRDGAGRGRRPPAVSGGRAHLGSRAGLGAAAPPVPQHRHCRHRRRQSTRCPPRCPQPRRLPSRRCRPSATSGAAWPRSEPGHPASGSSSPTSSADCSGRRTMERRGRPTPIRPTSPSRHRRPRIHDAADDPQGTRMTAEDADAADPDAAGDPDALDPDAAEGPELHRRNGADPEPQPARDARAAASRSPPPRSRLPFRKPLPAAKDSL